MLAVSAVADVLQLKEGYPETYVVKKGDTLWDISGHFLKSPWLWPRLWQVNPQVRDPHWIYPGDVLHLVWVNGEPRLVQKHMVKLSPTVRVTPKQAPVPTLPLERIAPFLTSYHIFNADSNMASLPYIVGNNSNDIGLLEKTDFFVRGSLLEGKQYGIYRPGELLKDKATGEALGREATLTGIALAGAKQKGGLTAAVLLENKQDVQQGDRLILMPEQENLDAYFTLQAGALSKPGYIIDIPSKISVVGKYDVVTLNKGARDGVASGNVFSIYRPGAEVTERSADDIAYKLFSPVGKRLFDGEGTHLPEQLVGQLMVFKVYDKTSMAMILKANDTVRQGYLIGNP
ncbi:MAG: LysM peptidoglycan-binding domain-containing protein [Aeromonadaceae bacterium]